MNCPLANPVGYGARFVTTQPTRVGVVAMGYADGYPRQAPTGTPVLVDGQRSQLVGRVSMDMLCVDLTNVPRAGLGSTVELWGKNILASDVAKAADTIPYQIFCNLRRVATALFRALTRGVSYRKSLHRTGFGSKCCKY